MRELPQQAEGLKRHKRVAMETQGRGGAWLAARETPELTFSPLAVEDLRAIPPNQRLRVFSSIEHVIQASNDSLEAMTATVAGNRVVWLSHLPSGWVVERIVPARSRAMMELTKQFGTSRVRPENHG